MTHSNNQLIRILTIVIILGAVLFIFIAQIKHLKSNQDLTSGETIYIQQDEGLLSTQDNEATEDYEEIVSNEIDAPEIKNDIDINENWADTSIENINFEQTLDFEHITLLIANMNTNERERVLSDQELFKQVIENEANNRSAVMAAVNNSLINILM